MALIAGYTLTPAHNGGPWSLTGPYTDATTLTALQCHAEARGLLRPGTVLAELEPGWADMELLSHPLASRSSPWLLPGTELLSPARPQLLGLLKLITMLPSGARGLLTLRLMPNTAMEDMVDTDSAATEPTTLATVMEAMARGLLTLR